VVVRPVSDWTAGLAKRGYRWDHAPVAGHRRLMRDDRRGTAKQRDLVVVHISAVRGEQPGTEEAVLVEKGRRTETVKPEHEIDLGAALRQVDRVAEIAFLGEGTDGMQQFGRGVLGQRSGGKDADASLSRAMPRAEQIGDAPQSLIAEPGREPRGFASGEKLR